MVSTSDLPALNAGLNATSGLLLILGFIFIRQKRVTAHRRCMTAAIGTSGLFLLCYLIYHFFHGSTRFAGVGWARTVYFTILISHTILAVGVLPFILATFYRGLREQFAAHQRVARWTFPVWLYVSLTGVVVYLMLYQLYPRR
jgi:uncharacterized membrane protein YozB (DUF420 family)